MFEGISGRSNVSASRKRLAFATALGLHAAVIGGALLYAQLTRRPDDQVIVEPPGIHVHLQQTGTSGRGKKVTPIDPPVNTVKPSRPRPQRPPRSMPADPASVPLPAEPPETISQPLSPDSPSTGEGPGGAEGPGDAGRTGPGSHEVPCPEGMICSQDGEQIYTGPGGFQRPRPNCDPPAPLAPPAASQFGLEGRVVAQFVVHADGRADAVNILNNDAPPMFAEAVRAWIEHCGFQPAEIAGAPHAVRIIQTFHFRTR